MVGILGGTFDPPHIGHLILADEARSKLDLEKILWVLTPEPPHKRTTPISPIEIRLQMVLESIRENPHFELSRADIDRPAPHYALGTMKWLKERLPEKRFIYLMGGDSLRDLLTWHRPLEFVQYCDRLGVMHREGVDIQLDELENAIPGLREKVVFLDVPIIEISGTDIRRRVRVGDSFQYMVTPEVANLIQKFGLYQSEL